MRKEITIRNLLLISFVLLFAFSCHEESVKLEFYGKWTITEIVLDDLKGDIQTVTSDYNQCVVNDILEFTIASELVIDGDTENCDNLTYPYVHIIDLTIDSKEKIIGFQVLPIVNQIYHPLVGTSEYFFIKSMDIDHMEISSLARCKNQLICTRIIRLRRV